MAKKVRLYADAWEAEGRLFDADHAKRILSDPRNNKITDKPQNANKRGNTAEDREEEE